MIDNSSVIFHTNLLRRSKWLGMIDYKSLTVLAIYVVAIINTVNILPIDINYKIYIDMFCIIPVIVTTICSIDNENIIDVLKVVIRYNVAPNLYVYNFAENEEEKLMAKIYCCK